MPRRQRAATWGDRRPRGDCGRRAGPLSVEQMRDQHSDEDQKPDDADQADGHRHDRSQQDPKTTEGESEEPGQPALPRRIGYDDHNLGLGWPGLERPHPLLALKPPAAVERHRDPILTFWRCRCGRDSSGAPGSCSRPHRQSSPVRAATAPIRGGVGKPPGTEPHVTSCASSNVVPSSLLDLTSITAHSSSPPYLRCPASSPQLALDCKALTATSISWSTLLFPAPFGPTSVVMRGSRSSVNSSNERRPAAEMRSMRTSVIPHTLAASWKGHDVTSRPSAAGRQAALRAVGINAWLVEVDVASATVRPEVRC